MTKEDLIAFEKKIEVEWQAGKIKAPVHFCGGNEDQLIDVFRKVRPDDYVFSSHRSHYHALLHVGDSGLWDEIIGRESGTCKGRARSMGYIHTPGRFYSSAIVGGMCAPAVGVALALQIKQKRFKADPLNTDEFAVMPPTRHVWCFLGDGGVDGGHFWEALTWAEGMDLPITFVIEDNDRATCSSVMDRMGINKCNIRRAMELSRKVLYYGYKATYPHVGTGKYVQF